MDISYICTDAIPEILGIFSISVAPRLLFYSYIPLTIFSLVLGAFLFIKGKRNLVASAFFAFTIVYSLNIINEIIQWIAIDGRFVHFAWQMSAIFQTLVMVFATYLTYVFINKKDMPFLGKSLLAIGFLPIILLLNSPLNMLSFDVGTCQSNFSNLWYYIYILEALLLIANVFIGIRGISKSTNLSEKTKNTYYTFGGFVFMCMYVITNIFGDYLNFYDINLVGPIGMLFFILFITFLISKYDTFKVDVGFAQITVGLLVAFISAQFFFITTPINKILNLGTLFACIALGLILINSVKKLIESKKEIERIAGELEKSNKELTIANTQKSEFVSFATHQLRAPVTSMKGYAAMIIDGDFGEASEKIKGVARTIMNSSKTLATVIDDYLNISKMELNEMKYYRTKIELNEFVNNLISEIKPNLGEKPLDFSFSNDGHPPYYVVADADKLKQIFSNLIDNAIKYTEKGSIKVFLKKDEEKKKIIYQVIDTGVGFPPELKAKLFVKFSRAKDASAVNIRGSGLGLYIANEIAKAHGGIIVPESEGDGKGSTFSVILPEAGENVPLGVEIKEEGK